MAKIIEWLESEESKILGANFTYSGCPDVNLNIGGNCPVQAEGQIEDDNYYFRARHDNWRFEIYDGNDESVIIYSKDGNFPISSWMPIDDALKIIGQEIHLYWKKQGAYRRIEKVWGKKLLDKFKSMQSKDADNGKDGTPKTN